MDAIDDGDADDAAEDTDEGTDTVPIIADDAAIDEAANAISEDGEEIVLSSEDDYTWDEDGTTVTGLANTYTSGQRISLIIPEKATAITHHAFSYNKNIVSLSFAGDQVTSIGYWAFNSCSNLESVYLSDQITEIGTYVFASCSSLREVHLSEGLQTLGQSAFERCTSLTEITIPAGVTGQKSVFDYCTALTKLIYAEGTKVAYGYGSSDVMATSPVTTVVLPDSIEEIDAAAFYNYTALTDIELPENLKSIGASAFSNCKSLPSINLPEGLETLGNGAFGDCTSLTEIYVPGSITSLGTSIFMGCSSLTSIEYGEGITKIYKNGSTALVHVKLPSTVTMLYDAFYGCDNLQTVNLPASLETIANGSFASGTGYLDQITELRFEGDGNINIYLPAFNNDGGSRDIPVYCPYGSKVYNYFINKTGFVVYASNAITYELNGGINSTGNPGSYTRGDDLAFQDPTRPGYTFTGWYTDSDLTTRFTYVQGTTDGNLTLYAGWEEIRYTITYNLDGGSLPTGTTNPTAYIASKDYTLVAPIKEGAVFIGWQVNDTDVVIYDGQIVKGTYAENLTLTALWREYSYQIIWNSNAKDATGQMSSTMLRSTEEFTISAGDYERTGYDVASWNTKANGKGTSYAVGEVVSALCAQDGGTITLYAQWQKSLYEIVYELNGGTNNKSNPDSYSIGKSVALKAPTRLGYIFGGWYADEELSDKVTKITSDMGDVTIYAQWTPITYTITFNKNKGTLPAGAAMDSITTAYDQVVTLPANAFVRTGYTFDGWSTSASGKGVAYDDQETTFNMATKNNAKVTLYAQWQVNQIPITYVLNDSEKDPATNAAKNPAYVTIEKNVVLSAPSRAGYTFKGWYTDEGLTTALAKNTISNTTTEPVTVYAAWSPITYTLKLDKNGGTYTIPAGIAGKYAFTDAIVLPNGDGASRTNYELTGWNTKKDRSGTHYDLGETVSGLAAKGTVTLYAEWTPIADKVYAITYHNVDDWDNSKNPETYSFEKDAKLVSPTRTGYTFKGWYAEDPTVNTKAKKVTAISKKSTGDMDLYGVWSENSYTIAYNANKGTLPKGSKMAAQTVLYSDEVNLTANVYTRKGYEFAGWNTKANGSGIGYADAESVSGLVSKAKGKITLYAQWEAIEYSITYVNADMDGVDNPNPATYTITKDVKLADPSLYGYTFKGWYGVDPEVNPKAKKVTKIAKTTAADTTVYAQWTENRYSLRFSGGSVKSITNRLYTDELTIPSTVPTKDGYTFKGWALTRNGSVVCQPGDTISFEELHAAGGIARGVIGTKYMTLYAIFWPNT